jgi:protein DGCR14
MSPSTASSPALECSLNQQHILDEDEYTEALSRIIARDFFPSLVHLDATNHYLDALQSRDPHLIDASVRRLQEINTPAVNRPFQSPSQTPYGALPSETPTRGEPHPKRPRFEKDLSLDDFQAKYTSEDNSSFTQILDEENRKRKERWAWAWDAQKRVEEQRYRMVEGREKRLLEAPSSAGVREKMLIDVPHPTRLLTSASVSDSDIEEGRGTGSILAIDKGKGKELTVSEKEEKEEVAVDVMARKKDTRSAGVEGWKFKVCNFTVTLHPGNL